MKANHGDIDDYQKNFVVVHRNGNADREEVQATVKIGNIGEGTDPSAAVRKAMKQIGAPGDQAGHLIAKVLGGPGSNLVNFVPLNPKLNTGRLSSFEKKIKKKIAGNKTWEARIVIVLTYNTKAKYPKRPVTLYYVCKFYEGNTYKDKWPKRFRNVLQ